MKFIKAFDIHSVPPELRKHIQPGQWVFASEPDARGRYMGQRPGGSDVVAWQRNARAWKGKPLGMTGYNSLHRQYAQTGSMFQRGAQANG